MGSSKQKIEFLLTKEEVPDWLHTMADAVAAGVLPQSGGSAIDLGGCRSLKISLKDSGPQMRAKISVSFHRPSLEGAIEGRPETIREVQPGHEGPHPKYKSLKKHMKQTFRALGQAIMAGNLPPALEASSFIADSKLMVTYAGKGDEFYAAYLEKTEAFEAALASGNMEALTALYQDLARLKRECHSRHG